MKVPLSVKNFPRGNKEVMQIWFDGQSKIVNAPIRPYFYSEKDIKTNGIRKTVKKIRLSDYKKNTFYKHGFNNVYQVPRNRKSGVTYEDNIPFILRVRVDKPNFYTKFPNKNKLKFLFLDIEQYTGKESYFPTYNDRIISIAYCTNDKKMQYLYLNKDSKSDQDLLEFFVKDFAKINPDVVVAYNKNYDIPTIIRRCEEGDVDTKPLTRINKKPYLGGKSNIEIPGRVIYDVYDSVKGDQSLTGNVPNRGLKAVSDYFGFETEHDVIDTSKTYKYVGTETLKKYNIDDVKRLLHLFEIYFPNIIETAEQLKIPLSEAVDLSTTDLGIIVMGEMYNERNIVANGLNYDRYPGIFQRKDNEAAYQGALIGIKKKGLFKPIIKADFSCVDDKTECLTRRGWKKYYELQPNEEIVTWNSKNDTFEYEVPEKINTYDYDGKLINIETRFLSMNVTPNHRVYYYNGRKFKSNGNHNDRKKIFVNRADKLHTYIDIPITSKLGGHTPEHLKPYIPLMAWIITEASISNEPRITMSQRKCASLKDSVAHLRQVIKMSGVPFKEKKGKNRADTEFFLSTDTSRMILSLMGNDGKHIPDFIFDCNYKTRREFIKELVYGDGIDYRKLRNTKQDNMAFSTINQDLAEQFQRLCVISGYRTSLSKSFEDYEDKTTTYYIHIFETDRTRLGLNQKRGTKDQLYQRKQYKGKVWCPTTKNQTWLCRRNNKVHITGNSMYPNIMANFNLSPDTCSILETLPYKKNGFQIVPKEHYILYYIPDNKLRRTVVIKVLKEKGFLSKIVKEFLDSRAEYKKKWKETGIKKYKALSDIEKVKANGGVYGIQGASKHPFGYAPIALATTGIARVGMTVLINTLEELYPKSVIEWDSITGDTPVFIRDKSTNEIDIIPVEDLSDGSLRQPVDKYETLTRNGWKDLQYIYCHNVNKTIYTIDTASSRVDITEDHSIFSGGKEVKPTDLNIGDSIDIYPSKDYGGENVEINKNQAWLIGFFLSDGTIIRRRRGGKNKTNELKIVKLNKKLLEKCIDIFKNDFNVQSKIYDIRKTSNVYKIEVTGRGGDRKKVVKHLQKICYCKDKKTKKVPKEILNATLDIVESFMEGLTDGDGYITQEGSNKGKWSISSKFKPLASGISYLLDRLGKTYNITCRKDKPHITKITTHKPNINRYYKKHSGKITKFLKEKKEQKVYDLGTEDGTFVAGVGRVICHNTDGVYFNTDNFVEKEFQSHFDKRLKEKFKQDFVLDLGYDYYDSGYFYKSKNYILKKDDVIIFHGATMKGSHRDNLSKNFINEISRAKIEGKDVNEIMQRYQDLSNFPLKDFVMTTTQSRDLSKYKSKTSLSYKMALKAQHYLGLKPRVGNQYHYVKTIYGYDLFQTTEKSQVDYKYYKNKIQDIIEMFKADFQMFKPLGSFMEDDNSKEEEVTWEVDDLDQEETESEKVKSDVDLTDFY